MNAPTLLPAVVAGSCLGFAHRACLLVCISPEQSFKVTRPCAADVIACQRKAVVQNSLHPLDGVSRLSQTEALQIQYIMKGYVLGC